MSYVAATLVEGHLGRFICGLYPEYAPEEGFKDGDDLGIIVRRDLDAALDGLSLIMLLLKTKSAEVQINVDELATYLEEAHELVLKLTHLSLSCEKRMKEEEAELQDALDNLDEDAVDEVMSCDCPVCTESGDANQ